MNPSSSGWIKKFGHLSDREVVVHKHYSSLYQELLSWGVVFGIHNQLPHFIHSEHKLLIDERAKINVLYAQYHLYLIHNEYRGSFEDFTEIILLFYERLNPLEKSFLDQLIPLKDHYKKLEKVIESRIYIHHNFLSKTLGQNVLNAYLFQDVLSFKSFLEGEENIQTWFSSLEHQTHLITHKALEFVPSVKYKLSPILNSSLTFTKNFNPESFEIKKDAVHFDPHIQSYIIDWAYFCIALEPEGKEKAGNFLNELGYTIGHLPTELMKNYEIIQEYISGANNSLYFLKDSNPAAQLYGKMGAMSEKLILRNSKRLIKELKDSGELLVLLSKSTHKDLTAEEKQKIQEQLLDIFKSIPSLAIFMLPGGAVLLPMFIKLIPKLLPSAFDENRIVEK